MTPVRIAYYATFDMIFCASKADQRTMSRALLFSLCFLVGSDFCFSMRRAVQPCHALCTLLFSFFTFDV